MDENEQEIRALEGLLPAAPSQQARGRILAAAQQAWQRAAADEVEALPVVGMLLACAAAVAALVLAGHIICARLVAPFQREPVAAVVEPAAADNVYAEFPDRPFLRRAQAARTAEPGPYSLLRWHLEQMRQAPDTQAAPAQQRRQGARRGSSVHFRDTHASVRIPKSGVA